MSSKANRSAHSTRSERKSSAAALKNLYSRIRRNLRLLLRRILAAISLVTFLLVVPHTANRYLHSSKYFNPSIVIPAIAFNDITNGSIQTRLNLSTDLFQIGLLVVAGLGGLLISKNLTKNGEADFVLSKPPEIIMYVCASLFIILSLVLHYLYVNEISNIYNTSGRLYDASNPDILDVMNPNINFLFDYQFYYLLSGVVLTLFTFFSAHIIKGGKAK